jgi:hypothetical protein
MTIKEPELQEGDLAVIQHAVTLARDRQIRRVETLRAVLEQHKYTKREIDTAIGFWAHYEQTKPGAGTNG